MILTEKSSKELRDYDQMARAEFGSKPKVWLARFVLELPTRAEFYPQQFRHSLGGRAVLAGIPMPDINQALSNFQSQGMIKRDLTPAPCIPHMYVYSDTDAWQPYEEFLTAHYEKHDL